MNFNGQYFYSVRVYRTTKSGNYVVKVNELDFYHKFGTDVVEMEKCYEDDDAEFGYRHERVACPAWYRDLVIHSVNEFEERRLQKLNASV